jgi:hypothetical protein
MSKHDCKRGQSTTTYANPRGAPDHRVCRAGRHHWIEHQTGWSIKKFVRTARRYRTVQIKAGGQILTAADPLPDDMSKALAEIGNRVEHSYENGDYRVNGVSGGFH